jgi:hypothetical protein
VDDILVCEVWEAGQVEGESVGEEGWVGKEAGNVVVW